MHSDRRFDMNQANYVEILKRLRQAVHKKWLGLWPNNLIIRHDNAPTHKALRVKKFLPQKSITEIEYLPHPLDLSPNDFRLLLKLKSLLKGKIFHDTEDIQIIRGRN
jgi:hypothetical protein